MLKIYFLLCYELHDPLVHMNGIYDRTRRVEESRAFYSLPVIYVFIINTCDSYLMFIYSQKHVQQA